MRYESVQPAPPASLEVVQQRLMAAQEDRRKVQAMRPKTESIAQQASRLLAKNHFAERVRRSFS